MGHPHQRRRVALSQRCIQLKNICIAFSFLVSRLVCDLPKNENENDEVDDGLHRRRFDVFLMRN